MAHGLTKTDMMVAVREPAWHGLGVTVDGAMTAHEAQTIALPWRVLKKELYMEDPMEEGLFHEIPRQFATVREDTNEVLGIVGVDYEPLQNDAAFKFMDALCQDPGGPKYETAGSLHGGRKVWMLCRMPTFIEVNGHDTVREYLLLSNTHDGSRRVEVLWTPIRVVCQNTLSMALGGGRTGRVRFKHTGSLMGRMEEAQDILGIARQNHQTLEDAIGYMQQFQPTDKQTKEILTRLYIDSTDTSTSIPVLSPSQKNAIHMSTHFFREGAANKAAGDTESAWALYNGIAEFVDYGQTMRQGRVNDPQSNRVNSNWFGQGANKKVAAFNAVMDYAMAAD